MTSATDHRENSPVHIAAIRADSLREQVSRALEAALVAGELQPGVLYSAPGLAEQFGVSATPVREAMLDLVKDGFVEVVRNKGFRVLEISESDLDQISQIRLLLEVPTTAMAAAITGALSSTRSKPPMVLQKRIVAGWDWPQWRQRLRPRNMF